MAIISVKEDWGGLSAHESADAGEVTRKWTMVFDGSDLPVIEPLMALGDPRIPKRWDTHPFSPWIYVQDRTAVLVKPHYYEVTIIYTTVEEPFNQPPIIVWDSAVSSEPIDREVPDEDNPNGKPITNSSNETFDPPIQKDFYDLILRINRNEHTFNSGLASAYLGSINSDNFYGFNQGQVKCNIFSGTKARAGGLWFWEVSYEFQIRYDGWPRRVLDEGYRVNGEVVDGIQEYQTHKDSEGNPLSQPVLLDGQGGKLKASANPEFLFFNVHYRKSFAALEL